ncbi:hypothetical protein K438DRAFT_539574 [Mycena galopus ATCC 62051]|nr:hypothetical protein K438DRAFT_539574 [Mycena galopus ATCC 62051]
MLSPEESALTIFGSYDDLTVVVMAQSLAELSGFPVVIRPASDNPALTLLACDTDLLNGHVNNASGNNNERERDTDDEGETVTENEHTPGESGNGGRRNNDLGDAQFDGNALNTAGEHELDQDRGAQGAGGGGGGGDGGEPNAVDGKWDSPLHRTSVALRLKLNTSQAYEVNIGYTFKVRCM